MSRDLLQFLPHHRRSLTAAEWELAAISCRLRSLLDDLPNGSAQDLLLARLVIRNIEWLTGKQMHFDDVQSEFTASLHSKYPTVAWAGIAHLLQMSFSDGVRSWRMLHRRLKDAHRSDYLAKNYEILLLTVVAMLVSRIGLFFPAVAHVVIRIAYALRTQLTEGRFSKQLLKWERWREHWATTGTVSAEIR